MPFSRTIPEHGKPAEHMANRERTVAGNRTAPTRLTAHRIMKCPERKAAMANYTAREIAHYIIDKCTRDGHPISNLQLQKILYFVQIDHYRARKEFLFFDEFEAWQYGPVLPEVYDEYSFFGGTRVRKTYDDVVALDAAEKRIVDKVVEDRRKQYPWDLVKVTHAPGSPWAIAFEQGNRTPISNAALSAQCVN